MTGRNVSFFLNTNVGYWKTRLLDARVVRMEISSKQHFSTRGKTYESFGGI
eukprot:m.34426 g.34426  ORF g.34426 m.34426 type:complete len:51 (+) comp31980_c0_seq3:1766-1918(+)